MTRVRESSRTRPQTWIVLLLLAPLAGVATWQAARSGDEASAQDRFERLLATRAAAVESELASAVETLHFLAALYDSSDFVTREEFATFTKGPLGRHPYLQAVEWAPRVSAREVGAHIAGMRATGIEGYEIREISEDGRLVPAQPRADYFPVTYVEPQAGNEQSLGLDLASEASRRAALERAVETGKPEITDPLRLVQESGSSPSILLFLPICDLDARTAAARRETLQGVVLLVWRVEDLMGRALRGFSDDMIAAARVDLERGEQEWLPLFPVASDRHAIVPSESDSSATLRVSGRTLRLTARPGPAIVSRELGSRAVLLGLLVAILTGLLGFAVLAWASAIRRKADETNLRLTRSLLRSLDQGVVVADAEGRIRLVNEAARGILGDVSDTMSPPIWSARSFARRIANADPDAPEESLPLGRAVAGEHFEDEEHLVRTPFAPEGRWLRVSGAPLQAADGRREGGVVVFRDITRTKAHIDRIRRLTTAVDQAADVIFITDRGGKILYANGGFEKTTGYSRSEAVGNPARLFESGLADGEEPGLDEDLWSTILAGKVWHGATVNRRKDGARWYAEQSVTPMKDPAGEVTHFVFVLKDMTEKRKLEEHDLEMRLAALVQQRLYPQGAPAVPGLDLAGRVVPTAVACGDYYDYIPLPDKTLGLVVGDVSGHGLGPALIMVEARAHLRSLLAAGTPLAEAVARLNRILLDDIPENCFVTLIVARVDPRARRLSWVNAGHPAGFVVGGATGEPTVQLEPTGPALGVLHDADYEVSETVQLGEGDVITLVTDGLTEALSPQDELYETRRVVEVVRRHHLGPARVVLDELHASVLDFARGRSLGDDVTMLVCRLGVPHPAIEAIRAQPPASMQTPPPPIESGIDATLPP